MAELEVRVLSERRDGLLIELGRVVQDHGYVLLRQRLMQEPQGASLTMVLRGSAERQLPLEEALGTHPRVLSFESKPHEPDQVDAPSATSVVRSVAAAARAAPAAARPTAATSTASTAGPDLQRIEWVLPNVAKDYPKIFPLLINLGQSVPGDARDASLHLIGRRTGTWIYKRDFAQGFKLGLADAIKRIVLPAVRVLVPAELNKERLHIRQCPLCQVGNPSGGRFFCGFIEGLLAETTESRAPFVRETHCHSLGSSDCVFEISH